MTVQTTAGQSRDDLNLNHAGLPIIGGDAPGQNLVLRSTNSQFKGSVIIDENTHSHSIAYGALTVPNGSVGVGGNVNVGGYNIMMAQGLSVNGYIITAAGSSYSTIYPPLVQFSAPEIPGGMQAVGIGQVNASGAITGVTIVVPGTGYIRTPTMTFVSGGLITGSGATGTAVMGYTSAIHSGCIHQSGYVQSIVVSSAGSSIASGPPIVIISKPDIPGGIQATAIATMSSATVSTIVITNPGTGYLSPPTVTFSYGNATAFAILGNPGIKPLVSNYSPGAIPGATPIGNAITLDFSLTGHNIVYMYVTTNTPVINFDATKGFPVGRQVVVYVKSGGATSLTLTGFTAGNSSTGSATITLTNARTTRLEFNVLTAFNGLSDVFVTQTG